MALNSSWTIWRVENRRRAAAARPDFEEELKSVLTKAEECDEI
jgi:hypothetical protein